METRDSRQGDVVVVAINGKLDAISSPQLETRLLEHIDAGEKKLVLDLSQVSYVSSAGIRAFLVAHKRMKDRGGQVSFAGLTQDVRRVFDLTGFSFRVPLFDTAEAAVKSS